MLNIIKDVLLYYESVIVGIDFFGGGGLWKL